MAETVSVIFEGVDRLSAPVKSMGASVKTFAAGVAGMATGMAAFAAGSKVVGFAKSAFIDLNSTLEQSEIAFGVMLGSSEAADAHLKELAAFAAKTPFEFTELIGASKRMQAYGFAAESVVPILGQVSDVAAGTGASVDTITLALGQMQTRGKASLGDLNQLAGAGVPIYEDLAKVLGVDMATAQEMVTAGQVDMNTVMEAFTVSSARFSGMAEAQSKTFAGAMSTIQDTLKMTMATSFRPFFDLMTEGLVKFGAFLGGETFQTFAASAAQAGVALSIGLVEGLRSAYDGLQSVSNIIELLKTGDFKGGIFGLQEDSPWINALFVARNFVGMLAGEFDALKSSSEWSSGTFETIATTLDNLTGIDISPLGIAFDGIKLVISDMASIFEQSGLVPSFQDLNNAASPLAGVMASIREQIDGIAAIDFPTINEGIATLATNIGSIAEKGPGAAQALVDLGVQVQALNAPQTPDTGIPALNNALAGIDPVVAGAAIPALMKLVPLLGPVGILAVAAAGLATAYATNFMGIQDTVNTFVTNQSVQLPGVSTSFANLSAEVARFGETFSFSTGGATQSVNTMVGTVNPQMLAMGGQFTSTSGQVQTANTNMWVNTQTAATSIGSSIGQMASSVLNGMTEIASHINTRSPEIQRAMEVLGNTFRNISETVMPLLARAAELAAGDVEIAVNGMVDNVKEIIDGALFIILFDWGKAWDDIANAVENAPVLSNVQTLVDGVGIAISIGMAIVQTDWGGIWNNISNKVNEVSGTVTGFVNTMAGNVETAFGRIKTAANSVISTLEGILNTVRGIVADITSAINSIPTPSVSIPGFQSGGVVPGPVGAPMLAMVHGGERIIPAGGAHGGRANAAIHVTINAGTLVHQDDVGEWLEEVLRRYIRNNPERHLGQGIRV